MKIPTQEMAMLVVIVAVFVLSTVSRMQGSGDNSEKARYVYARQFVNQSVQWAAMYQQDTNPVFGLRHINYANAYLKAARNLVSDAGLERATGKDIHALEQSMRKMQQSAVASVAKSCPKTLPKGTTVTNWL